MFETIVALATPAAKSALAIIRLSGDDCFNVVSNVFSKDITKETGEKDYSKIINFNKKFHERCEKGLKKYTSSTVDELIEEILGPDKDDTNRVYRK